MAAKTILKTQTLREFLAENTVCRVWYCGVGCPTGAELWIDLEGDGEDYCDSDSLLEFIPDGAEEIDGEVSRDKDGEYRWEPITLQYDDLRDDRGNTVYNLTVWGD